MNVHDYNMHFSQKFFGFDTFAFPFKGNWNANWIFWIHFEKLMKKSKTSKNESKMLDKIYLILAYFVINNQIKNQSSVSFTFLYYPFSSSTKRTPPWLYIFLFFWKGSFKIRYIIIIIVQIIVANIKHIKTLNK